jgi:hypothetical protein
MDTKLKGIKIKTQLKKDKKDEDTKEMKGKQKI